MTINILVIKNIDRKYINSLPLLYNKEYVNIEIIELDLFISLMRKNIEFIKKYNIVLGVLEGKIKDKKEYRKYIRLVSNMGIMTVNRHSKLNNAISTEVSPVGKFNKALLVKNANIEGILSIKTLKINENTEAEQLIKELGLPLIIKPNKGECGINVFLCESKDKIDNLLQSIKASDIEFISQEFIENDFQDMRWNILNGSLICASIRHGNPNDINRRNNLSQGGTDELYYFTEDDARKAKEIAIALNKQWIGVDIIRNEKGDYFLEANLSPSILKFKKVNVYIYIINELITEYNKKEGN